MASCRYCGNRVFIVSNRSIFVPFLALTPTFVPDVYRAAQFKIVTFRYFRLIDLLIFTDVTCLLWLNVHFCCTSERKCYCHGAQIVDESRANDDSPGLLVWISWPRFMRLLLRYISISGVSYWLQQSSLLMCYWILFNSAFRPYFDWLLVIIYKSWMKNNSTLP